jgi:hypothetical protein
MKFSKKTVHSLLIGTIFTVAMAYVEATIVVYLRNIYYPQGFHFPLAEVSWFIVLVEAGREAATIIMLYAVARMLAAKSREILFYFFYAFGIWDIFYYAWLKILLNWPSSLLQWDVLFLIPLPWIGPVLAPLLVSLGLIGSSLVMLYYESSDHPLRFKLWEIVSEITAALLIIISFLTETRTIISARVPQNYYWWLFAAGYIPGIFIFVRKIYLHHRNLEKPATG